MSSVVQEPPNGSLQAKNGLSGQVIEGFRELPVDVGDDLLRAADNGGNSKAAGMRGWMSKLGGHRVKVWRRRFFSYDPASGRLQYYKDDSDKSPVLGVISIPNVLYTTLRTDTAHGGGGMWPTGVPTKRCLQIVTPARTFCMYCDSSAETQKWLTALRGSAGASYGGIEIEITAVEHPASDASLAGTNLQLTDAVKIRGTPDSQSAALAASAELMENEHIVRQYNLANVSSAARNNIIRWHALKEKALKGLNVAYGLDDTAHAEQCFSVECDLGRLYEQTAPVLRARLGEYVLGDYTDELCHNLRQLARHPMGKGSVLELLPKRRVLFQAGCFHDSCAASSASSLDKQGITVKLNLQLVGREAHLVAMDALEALRVTSSAQEHHMSVAIAAARRGPTVVRCGRAAATASDNDPAADSRVSTLTSHHSGITCSDDAAGAAVSTSPSEKSDLEEQSQSSVVDEEEDPTTDTELDPEPPLSGAASWTKNLTGVRVATAMDGLDAVPQLEAAARKLRRWAAPLCDVALTVQWRELDYAVEALGRDVADGGGALRRTLSRSLMGVVLPTVLERLAVQCRVSSEHRATLNRNTPRGILSVLVRASRKAPNAGKRLLQLKSKRESEACVLVVTVCPARFAGRSGAQLREEAGKCKVCKWLETLT